MNNSVITQVEELDAVNDILSTIGEAPVDNIDSTNIDAINAYNILMKINRKEQARGWSFNTIPDYKLVRDIDGHIHWNSLWLYVEPHFKGIKLVRDGKYVKDLYSGKTIFDRDIHCECIILQGFDQLPDAFKNYVVSKAAFEFQSKYFGDSELLKVTQMNIEDCWQILQEYELDNNDYNVFKNRDVNKLRYRGWR